MKNVFARDSTAFDVLRWLLVYRQSTMMLKKRHLEKDDVDEHGRGNSAKRRTEKYISSITLSLLPFYYFMVISVKLLPKNYLHKKSFQRVTVLVKYFWFYFVISITYEGADHFHLNLYRFSNYKMHWKRYSIFENRR